MAPETCWFNPRPGADGRGLIDDRDQLHTWPSRQADHAQMAHDRGVEIRSRLWIHSDGAVVVTGGEMDHEQALALAVAQDPRLHALTI